MKIKLLAIGKTNSLELAELISEYESRLKHYVGFELCPLPELKKGKSLPIPQQKELEAEMILNNLPPAARLILLDERGKQLSSPGFASYLQKQMNSGLGLLVFAIGGPYGFSEGLQARADGSISLSAMTFSHQMVRLFFVEQLYRAFTILANEPYHHQ